MATLEAPFSIISFYPPSSSSKSPLYPNPLSYLRPRISTSTPTLSLKSPLCPLPLLFIHPNRKSSFEVWSAVEEVAVEEVSDEQTQQLNLRKKLFVFNLPWSFTVADVKTLFGECGTVTDIEIIKQKNGKSRGFAFVTISGSIRPSMSINIMAEGIAFAILGKIGEYLVAPIGRQFKYLFCYNSDTQNLRDQIKKMEVVRDGVQLLVAEAENNSEVPAGPVREWLANVEKLKTESNRIFEHKDIADNGCLNGWCPNLKSRYLVSRKASKAAQEAVGLVSEGMPYNTKLSHPAPPASTAATTSMSAPYGFMGFESRMKTTKEVINALKNDTIGMIGICGMGGVGKTTMVKEVAERTKSENFNEVATAVVSQSPDLIKIQGQLADMLGLKLNVETSIAARAHYLRARLMNGRRILVILDDVWKAIDLNEIGIPFGEDRKGCKVVLTSRDEQVCSDMRADKTFTVKVLSDNEAWNLFKEMAGECVDTAEIHHIAEEVAKECGGLPLAIVTVGNALRNKKKLVWDDALHQLRNCTPTNIPGMHKKVYSNIILSFNYLESDQAKSLLLHCCVFREDEKILIESLVRNGKGLELFEDVETMEDTRNRVYSLVGQLKSCYLLLGDDENHYVKMHDVVRDVGLSIASKEEDMYMVRHDTDLEEWPHKDTYQHYTAISIYSNKLQELPAVLDCPKLKLLWLRMSSYPGLQISRDFFKGMKELKVIDFQGISTKPLPPSLQFLLNLRTLCLDGCRLGADISLIGNLHKLEILSFFKSDLDMLPSEIGKLIHLKLLDLRSISPLFIRPRGSYGPSIIPAGVLSRLKKLEELYIGDYFRNDASVEGKCTIITELNSLARLTALQISILGDPEFLLKFRNFHFENLKRFEFSMSMLCCSMELGENSVLFNGVDSSVIVASNINVLMRRTRKLALKEVRGLKNVVKDLDEEGLVKLKTLEMCDCPEVEYVVDAVDLVPSSAFIFKLESLDISNMDNLKEICHGNLPARSFERLQELSLCELPTMRHLWRGLIQPPCLGNLRHIWLSGCDATKYLFPLSVVKCLMQLQTLEIRFCNVMEGIVSKEEGETHEKIIEFPKLIELNIQWLPKFSSFYISETEDNQQVLLPSMETLLIICSNKLVQIVGDQIEAGSLYNLQEIRVSECELVESVFDFERLKVGGGHAEAMLNKLISMYLSILPKLTHIWRMVPKGFQGFHNLTSLVVHQCGRLRYLLSHLMAKMVVNLQELKLISCQIMEQVIKPEEEEEVDIKMMDKLVFPQLRLLQLENLENLTMFSFEKLDFELPLLEKVLVRNCPNMETFCSGLLSTPKLEQVYVERSVNWDTSWGGVNLDKGFWSHDLNSTIAFLKQRPEGAEDEPEDGQDSLESSSSIEEAAE